MAQIKPIAGIYCITNKINGKKYIGQSWNIYSRWSNHRRVLSLGRHDNTYLQNSFNKYGEDAFEYTIIEIIDNAELLTIREQYWCDQIPPELRYNLRPIANTNLGIKRSDENKQKHSDITKKLWESGKYYNEEYRRKNSESQKQNFLLHPKSPLSEETKLKISKAKKGKKETEESKQRNRERNKSRWENMTSEEKEKWREANKRGIAKRKEQQNKINSIG